MITQYLGEWCALGAALNWAIALVLFKRSGEDVPPLALNLFKNAVGIVLLAATIAIIGVIVGRNLFAANNVTGSDLAILMISGIIGIAIADTLLFASLNIVGVGIIAVVECTYSPLVLLCAYWLLDEVLTFWHVLAAGLIISGVLVCTRVRTPPHQTRLQLVWGLLLGVASMGLMAYGIVIAKPILTRMDLLSASFLRLAAGTVALALFAWMRSDRRATWSVFRPSRSWRFSVPGSVLGTYFALTLWIAGFKYTNASIAAILNQTSFLFTIILAAVVLREPFGPKKVICVCLSAAGITLVAVQTAYPGWLDSLVARFSLWAGI